MIERRYELLDYDWSSVPADMVVEMSNDHEFNHIVVVTAGEYAERQRRIKADRASKLAELAAERAAHAERVAAASGLRRAVMVQHAPEEATCAGPYNGCSICEWNGDYPASYPCPAYELARDWEG
jgi:hypothetical protein